MLLTHRKLLQSKAIAIENDLRGTLRNFGLKVGMVGTMKRLPDKMRVEVEPDIEVSAKTLGELRMVRKYDRRHVCGAQDACFQRRSCQLQLAVRIAEKPHLLGATPFATSQTRGGGLIGICTCQDAPCLG
jgi:hypothetical protein